MAAVSEIFSLGSIVWCRTCYDTEIEGEVLAFEPQNKILILKCGATNGNPKLNDIQFINLSLVSELQVKKEGNSYTYEAPQSLNLHRLNTRVRNQVEEKRRMFQAISANVSTEGQSLFLALSKMINEVRWRNSEIIIWDQEVVISPPYGLDNVKSNTNSSGLKYILKLVEKHLQDLSLNTQSATQNNRSSQ